MKRKIFFLPVLFLSMIFVGCSNKESFDIKEIGKITESLENEAENNNSRYYLIEEAVNSNKISNPVREFYWLTDVLFGVDINYDLASKSLLKVKNYDRETYDWMVMSLEDDCVRYGCNFLESVQSLKERYPNNAYLSAFIKSDISDFTYENGANLIYKHFNLNENVFENNLFDELIGNQSLLNNNAFFALSSNYRYVGSFNKELNICHTKSDFFDKDYCLNLYQKILMNDHNFLSHQYSRAFLSSYCKIDLCDDNQKNLLKFSSDSYYNRMKPSDYILEFKRLNYVFNRVIDTGIFCDDIEDTSDCYKNMEELNSKEKIFTALNVLLDK